MILLTVLFLTFSWGRMKRDQVVLVVDDAPSVREYVKTVLQEEGFEIIEASDGIDGYNLIQEFGSGIALVITDVIMPKMDGVSLAESVRELFPTMPVLLMTGYASTHRLPIESVVLQKPFSPDALVEAVRKVIEKT